MIVIEQVRAQLALVVPVLVQLVGLIVQEQELQYLELRSVQV